MKTISSNNKTFYKTLNSVARKQETRKTKNSIKRILITFLSSALILAAACSCSRNSSGCGTWPTSNTKTYKTYKNEVRPAVSRNSNQYAYYKKNKYNK